ncbi:PhzF family phenazine biosynthesis protein [Sphingorhabdus sp.]|jgi:trans-2,3-dihydro-3-hydroxyanthranilate isomerase|uniref:PhzF family phenazine biosynthesis protein n=1 Tax=Sphingorhabdus sp. TaxID=1902408 RepID=UPI0037C6A586
MTAEYAFVTLDVFTNQRFGGNPLVVFPDARGMDTSTMQALSREFNLSEAAFVLPPEDPANTAQVRIFTHEIELDFAGHPNVGVAWVLAEDGRDSDGLLRFEEQGGLVEVNVERSGGQLTGCRVAAPQPLTIEAAPSQAELAACAGLNERDLGPAFVASVALATACVPVMSPDALARARCNMTAFQAIKRDYPAFGDIFLLYLFVREGDAVHARMFAPLSGTNEDPATGSAACALTGALLTETPERDELTLTIVQGVEMRRPSRMRCEASRIGGEVRAWVSGECVPVLRGVAMV